MRLLSAVPSLVSIGFLSSAAAFWGKKRRCFHSYQGEKTLSVQPPEHPQTQRGLIPRFHPGHSSNPSSLCWVSLQTGRGSGFVLMGLSPGGICASPVGTPKPSPEPPFRDPGSHMGCGCPLASPPGNSPFPISSLAQPQAPAGWAQREAVHSLAAGILDARGTLVPISRGLGGTRGAAAARNVPPMEEPPSSAG